MTFTGWDVTKPNQTKPKSIEGEKLIIEAYMHHKIWIYFCIFFHLFHTQPST